jgi:hypothetical protein
MDDDRPQDYRDLLHLVAAIRDAAPRDPERQGIRARLLAKLTALVDQPAMLRGGLRLA